MESKPFGKSVARLGVLAAITLLGSSFLFVSFAGGSQGVRSAAHERSTTQSIAMGTTTQGDYEFNISAFAWEKPASSLEEPILSRSSPGQDARLLDCGSDQWDGSMLVLAPAGRAYCIEPIDRSDPEGISAARIAAMRLIDGGDFTKAELSVLRLQTLFGYAEPETAEATHLGDQLRSAWQQLTPAEQEHLSG